MNDLPPKSGYRDEEEQPSFHGWKKEHQPPEGYFDALPDRVMDRWHADQHSRSYRWLTFRRMIAAAAVVTGLSLGVAWYTGQSRKMIEPQPVTSAEALLYILENIHEFEPLIMQSLPPDTSKIIQGSTTDEAEEYLLEEMQGEAFENLF